MAAADVVAFVRQTRPSDLPPEVREQALVCLVDLLATAAGGAALPMARAARAHAVRHYGAAPAAPGARLLWDGRAVSPVGAAFANAACIESLDAHDGHAGAMGHAGVAVLPALLAVADARRESDGAALVATLAVGYEVALRAGIALHRASAGAHASGAWNALGCAAVAARLHGLSAEETRDALGIAEYHAPRGPSARVLAHPSMVKDASPWGAAAGVAAADLAREGFTGAPAGLVEDPGHAAVWAGLGADWEFLRQNFKALPIIRWAEPAVTAALGLLHAQPVDSAAVERVEVTTFRQAAALPVRLPATTEEAQYSLAFPLAAAIVHGTVGPAQVAGAGLHNREVRRLAAATRVRRGPRYDAGYPEVQAARVRLVLADGRTLDSGPCRMSGAPPPPSRAQAADKLARLAEPTLGRGRIERVLAAVEALDGGPAAGLLEAVLAP